MVTLVKKETLREKVKRELHEDSAQLYGHLLATLQKHICQLSEDMNCRPNNFYDGRSV